MGHSYQRKKNRNENVGQGHLFTEYQLEFWWTFSFLCQDVPPGMTISFPDCTGQIGEDMGFCLKKNIWPVNPVSMSCLEPDWSWGAGRLGSQWLCTPIVSRQGCFKLCVGMGPLKGTEAAPASRWPDTSTFCYNCTTATRPNVPGMAFHLNRCGLEAYKWHLLRR